MSKSLSLPRQHIKDLVLKNYGKLFTLKDVQNIRTKIKESKKGELRGAQLVLDKLSDELKKDFGSSGGVVVYKSDILVILYFQSSHMKKLF